MNINLIQSILGILLVCSACMVDTSAREEYLKKHPLKKSSRSVAYYSFTDERDNQTYQTIQFDNFEWMIENMNYETKEGSICYDNDSTNCNTYGRLYTLEAAINVCPKGWELPSYAKWKNLINEFDEYEKGGRSERHSTRSAEPIFRPIGGGCARPSSIDKLYFGSLEQENRYWLPPSNNLMNRQVMTIYVRLSGSIVHGYNYGEKEEMDRGKDRNHYSCRCVKWLGKE